MSKIPIDLTFAKRNIQGISFSKTVILFLKYVKFMSMLTGLKDIGLRLVLISTVIPKGYLLIQ